MSLTSSRAARRWRTALRTGAAAALAAGSLAAGVGTAAAAPVVPTPTPAVTPSATPKVPAGNNGTVKIHNSGTPVGDPSDATHVCRFYLDGSGFDPKQHIVWVIVSWPPTGNGKLVKRGILPLDAKGRGHTSGISLRDGHYDLLWGSLDAKRPKEKKFWVACKSAGPTPTPTPSSTDTPAPAPTPVRTDLPVTG